MGFYVYFFSRNPFHLNQQAFAISFPLPPLQRLPLLFQLHKSALIQSCYSSPGPVTSLRDDRVALMAAPGDLVQW
ncbi:hypothetical protein TYRP_020532 [Tyrophagus putrescentiae]|nr:hypothetical protein TYRP_020532 [Tyrophagus putrescentiae]